MKAEPPRPSEEPSPDRTTDAHSLRARAERIFQTNPTSHDWQEDHPTDSKDLIHELQVHQIELELQNEELRQTQSELELTLARYFELYDLAPVGYLNVAESGMIVAVNLTAATMLGMFRQELLNQPFNQFIHPEDQDRYHLYRNGVLATMETMETDLRLLKIGGECFWTQIVGSSAENSDGSITCRLVIHDIQARKDSEKEKQKLEMRLQEAEKLEAMGRLAGGVAHDFNNMLAVIIGSAELALAEIPESSPLHEDLTAILQAAERSAATTGHLLGFARQQTSSPQVLDLNQAISGIEFLLQRILGQKIRLDWQPQSDIWPVRMDPMQIEQILSNLCSNSAKALASGGVVSIQLANRRVDPETADRESTLSPGEYVSLTFFDNGCGMNQSIVQHAFDPFFTTAETGQGTGLGLAMVHGIITQNKGFILLDSKPGLGTTFQIYLPRCMERPEPIKPEKPSTMDHSHNETILLADDEPAVLRLTQRLLESQGYRIVAAATSTEAIQRVRQHQGDLHLVLTDVIMPQMNGRELVAELQTIIPGVKSLYMSGYQADVVASQGLLDPHVHFIRKPFKQQDLLRKIREILDQ